jgi:acyl-CoA thioesterase
MQEGEGVDANELANRVAHEMLAGEGTGPAWGITIEEAREDYARISMVVRADMLNSHGIAHGGMVFALADTAFAYVCNGANHASVAAQASIVFLDKVREGETLVAEAMEVAREGRAGVTRVAVRVAEDGRTIAEFTGYSRTLGGAVVEI